MKNTENRCNFPPHIFALPYLSFPPNRATVFQHSSNSCLFSLLLLPLAMATKLTLSLASLSSLTVPIQNQKPAASLFSSSARSQLIRVSSRRVLLRRRVRLPPPRATTDQPGQGFLFVLPRVVLSLVRFVDCEGYREWGRARKISVLFVISFEVLVKNLSAHSIFCSVWLKP